MEVIPKTSMQRLLTAGRKYTSGILMLHMIRNLIELELYAEAPGLLGHEGIKTDMSIIERKWGEILDRCNLPIELLYDQAKGANNKLLTALRAGL